MINRRFAAIFVPFSVVYTGTPFNLTRNTSIVYDLDWSRVRVAQLLF